MTDRMKFLLAFGTLLVTITVAFTNLQAQANELEKYKAERTEVMALATELDAMRRVLDRVDARTLRMACRQYPDAPDCP